jgi:hypothetical protein
MIPETSLQNGANVENGETSLVHDRQRGRSGSRHPPERQVVDTSSAPLPHDEVDVLRPEHERHVEFHLALVGRPEVKPLGQRGQDRAGPAANDLLDLLLAARDEESGTGMSDQQLKDEVLTLLFAGHDTTTAGLSRAWHLLARHPQTQEALHDEVAGCLVRYPRQRLELTQVKRVTSALRSR